MKKLIVAMTLPVVVGACACNGSNMAAVTTADLQQHNWKLVQIDGQDLATSDNLKAPRLGIDESMRATGHAGCNRFFGQAELNGNQFRIEKMGMSQKMCFGGVMKTERTFSNILNHWSTITLSEAYLELDNGDHKLTFKLNDSK